MQYVRADCLIADFQTNQVIDLKWGASVTVINTSFDGIRLPDVDGASIIRVSADERGNSYVRLEGCEFNSTLVEGDPDTPDASTQFLISDNRDAGAARGMFYGDSATPSVCVYQGSSDFQLPPCEYEATLPLEDAPPYFLSRTSENLVEVQQVGAPFNSAPFNPMPHIFLPHQSPSISPRTSTSHLYEDVLLPVVCNRKGRGKCGWEAETTSQMTMRCTQLYCQHSIVT